MKKGEELKVLNKGHVKLKENEFITNIKARFVHTMSSEYGSNIVGLIFTLNTGRSFNWDDLEYPNHSQECYNFDLNGGTIIGISGDWTSTTHP